MSRSEQQQGPSEPAGAPSVRTILSTLSTKLVQAQSIVQIAALALDNPSAVFEHGKNSYSMEVLMDVADGILSDALGSLESVESAVPAAS